jgi:leucyl aminopeptidase
MNITVQAGALDTTPADALVVNLFQGVTQPSGATGAIDQALSGAISHLISTGDFTGKPSQTSVLYPPAGQTATIVAPRVIVVGLGKRDDFTLDKVRQASATAARRARDLGVKRLATIVHGAGVGSIDPQRAAQAVAEGAILGLYRFDELKSRSAASTNEEDEPKKEFQELVIVELDQGKIASLEEGARRGRILAESQCFARTLVTRPGNVLHPIAFAEEAARHGRADGRRRRIGAARTADRPGACPRGLGEPEAGGVVRQGDHL